ncbi:unnamed protein product, partial [Didymodactylos carnosus]
WNQNAITVAGGHEQGSRSNLLKYPYDLFIDNRNDLYVADRSNHRIQKWSMGAKEAQTVAGGNREGSSANQLWYPSSIY